MNNINPSPEFIQRLNKDTPCGYLLISATFFRRFLDDYNSIEYGKVSLSFAHFYKSWDALFQSMILLSGRPIRKEPNTKFKLGTISGITDNLLNPISTPPKTGSLTSIEESIKNKKDFFAKEIEKNGIKEKLFLLNLWKVSSFRTWAENPEIAFNDPLFNSLDFLRELRNSSEHDFLEVGGGSYNSLILNTNSYMIPLVEKYIEIYSSFYEEIQIDCKLHHDHGRSKYCVKKELSSSFSPKFFSQITHFPLPASLVVEKIVDSDSSVSALIRKLIKIYNNSNRELLLDQAWRIEDTKVAQFQEEISGYVYSSISELALDLNKTLSREDITRYQVEQKMLEKDMKRNPLYVIRITTKKGKKSSFYSATLFKKLLNTFNQN